MRSMMFVCLLGCGGGSNSPDAVSGNRPDPRVIPGGGIGDGPIDGLVNLYVIDDASRTAIAEAEVSVGTVTGTTDATGLFVAEGVIGPQDVLVKASPYRPDLLIGVNGANVTVNLELANLAAAPSATLSGSIPSLVATALPANHSIIATVAYSQTVALGDPANDIAQAVVGGVPQNLCAATLALDPCNFTITSRTGKVALVARLIDNDSKGTPTPTDDTQVFVGWAVLQGLAVAAGTNQTGLTLTKLAANTLQTVVVDFGAPPAELTTRIGIVGIEIGDEGLLPLEFVASASPTLQAPKLTAVAGATGYRLTGFSTDSAPTDPRQSIVLRRALPGPALAAGSWIDPPTDVTLSRAGGAWSNAAGGTIHTVGITLGGTRLLNVVVLDSSRTTFTVPSQITLPSGSLAAAVNAIAAPGLDVSDFEGDRDEATFDRVSVQAATIAP